MQLKCIQNTIETQWNRLHLPYPATEFIILVAENKRRISDCDAGAGSKALDDGLLCSRRHFRLASVLQNGNSYRAGEAKWQNCDRQQKSSISGACSVSNQHQGFSRFTRQRRNQVCVFRIPRHGVRVAHMPPRSI